jgi:hypothetical protein
MKLILRRTPSVLPRSQQLLLCRRYVARLIHAPRVDYTLSCLDYLIALCMDQHLPITTPIDEQLFYLALWERRFKLT